MRLAPMLNSGYEETSSHWDEPGALDSALLAISAVPLRVTTILPLSYFTGSSAFGQVHRFGGDAKTSIFFGMNSLLFCQVFGLLSHD